MVGVNQNLNGSRDLTTPLSGMVVIRGLALATINLSIKFEVYNFTPYEATQGGIKYQKWGSLG